MKTQVCVSDALLIYTITRVLEPSHNDSTSAQNGNLHQSVVTRIRVDHPVPPASTATSKIFSLWLGFSDTSIREQMNYMAVYFVSSHHQLAKLCT